VSYSKDYRFLAILATGFWMWIYRDGIIDKTKMYEADSRTSLHDFSIWVLYSYLLLEIVRQNVFCGFLQKRFKANCITIIPIRVSFSV